jgi:hypothetical protein
LNPDARRRAGDRNFAGSFFSETGSARPRWPGFTAMEIGHERRPSPPQRRPHRTRVSSSSIRQLAFTPNAIHCPAPADFAAAVTISTFMHLDEKKHHSSQSQRHARTAAALFNSRNGSVTTTRCSCAKIMPIPWLCCRGAYGRVYWRLQSRDAHEISRRDPHHGAPAPGAALRLWPCDERTRLRPR